MRRRSLSELSELTGIIHPPSRRQTMAVLAGSFAIAVICWYFGVNAWHSILLGCAITVIALAVLAGSSAPDALDVSWRPGKQPGREGARRDISSLSSSLRSGWGFVGLTAERRLHEVARRRLALEGLDLRNPDHRPAIEQLIGERAYLVLRGRQGRVPNLRSLIYCLDTLDAIDSNHYPVAHPRARRWDLPVIPFSFGRRP
jgi:hypothetical protein